VAELPQYLSYEENRDALERVDLAGRRIFFTFIVIVAIAAALNVFGQRPVVTTVSAESAELEVFAPTALRGGLYYEGRLTVRPKREIDKATLVFDSGWTEQMQINTIEPSPVGEASRGGKLTLEYGHFGRGEKLVVYLQFQVNPTNVGWRSQDVELYDDRTLLALADRTVKVFP
jgi:hypothetical protein